MKELTRQLTHALSPKIWLPISYFTFFATWGILIPYFSIWLAGLGFNEQQIGNMIAVSLIARSLGPLLSPFIFKETSQLITGLRLLSFLCVLLTLMFFFPIHWIFILLIMFCYNLIMSPCIPLTDSLAVAWQKQSPFEYGKVRLWGSLGFIASTTLLGVLLDIFDYRIIIICLFITHIIFLFSTFIKASITFACQTSSTFKQGKEDIVYKHKTNNTASEPSTALSLKEIKRLIFIPTVFFIMFAIMLIQGSHAAYYNFAAIFWKKFNYSDTLIGIFISFSVVAEILFFAFGHRLVTKWSIRSLFLCCGIFTVIRWVFMANFTSIPLIFLMQSFHAITYVMGHLAMMRFISQFSNQQVIYLQAFYATMASGIGLAIFSSLSGTLLKFIGSDTFYVMAAVAFISLFFIPKQLQINTRSMAPSPL